MLWHWMLWRNRTQSVIVANAHVNEETFTHMVIGPKGMNWLGLSLSLAFTLLFVGLGVTLLVTANNNSDRVLGLLVGGFFGVLGLVLVIAAAGQQHLRADASARTLTLSRRNPLLGRFAEKTVALDTTHAIVRQSGSTLFRAHTVTVQTAGGASLNLQFGARAEDAARAAAFLQRAFNFADAAAGSTGSTTVAVVERSAMLNELRTWAIWLIIMGGLSVVIGLFAGVVSAPWGLMLIGVGVVSFFIREPAMFVIYGITVGWAAINNLLSGEGRWIGAAVVQVFIAVRQFQNFRRFRQSESRLAGDAAAPASEATVDRAGQFFPWAAAAFGALALIGFVVVIFSAFLVGAYGLEGFQALLSWMEEGAIVAAVLGIATGLASLLSGFRYKVASITGMALGLVTVLVELALLLAF